MTWTNTDSLLITAIQAALHAGSELKRGLGTSFTIDSKPGRHNLVTEYDKLSEQIIIDTIKRKFSNHSILAEESGSHMSSSEILWVIDPLDGTANFASAIPSFCVSIAATCGHDILCGVVYQPMTNELFTAQTGQGAFLNGRPIKTSSVADIKDAMIATGFPYNVDENPLRCIDQLAKVLHMGLPIRRIGSAALDLCYTAAGRFDAYWECHLEPWDLAAGKLILEEAGGKVTDYAGNHRPYDKKTSVLSSNSILHDQMIAMLKVV